MREFCGQAQISTRLFYSLQEKGEGPRVIRLGRRVLIAQTTATRWLMDRETGAAPFKQNIVEPRIVTVDAAEGDTSLPGGKDPRSRRKEHQGTLESGAVASWQWTKDGKALARAFLSTGVSGLAIRYETFAVGRPRTEVSLRVAVVRTPCHFGGSRPWLLCPNCGRRVAILYGDTRLACRHCRRPTYPIQMITPIGRALARAQKMRLELGGSVDLSLPFPARPKGMHSFTYTKLAIRAMVAEAQFNTDVGGWVDSIRAKKQERTMESPHSE